MTGKKIRFEPSGREFPVKNESSVLEVALNNDLDLPHSCGGMGSCTTCRVIVVHTPHPLPEREAMEAEIAEMRGFSDQERLACQLPPFPGLVVRVPLAGGDSEAT